MRRVIRLLITGFEVDALAELWPTFFSPRQKKLVQTGDLGMMVEVWAIGRIVPPDFSGSTEQETLLTLPQNANSICSLPSGNGRTELAFFVGVTARSNRSWRIVMKIRNWTCPLGLVIALAINGMLWGGSVSVSPALTDDASTGISSSKTYTHTISGGSAAAINGVDFDVLDAGNTPANFDWNTNGLNKNQIACCNNGDWDPAAGGVTGPDLINLLGSFTFSGNGDGNPASQTYTLSGLTPGATYDTRAYIRVWDTEGSGRPIDFTFTNGAEVDAFPNVLEDRPSSLLGDGSSDQNAYYVSYEFTAETSDLVLDATVVGAPPSGSFHMYALSNEVVPEPSSIALIAFGLLGMLSFRRRRSAAA